MSLTIDDLLHSPDHYLHSFDTDGAVFVPMDRAAYSRSIFLDARILPAGDGRMTLPLAALASQVGQPAPTSWIFHVAHCGSTLLARALDEAGRNLVLREPLALRQTAIRPDELRLRLALATVSKRYDPALPTVVKANVPVNFLLDRIAIADPSARAIFLYLRLEDYLLAILRDVGHREWLGNVTRQLAPYLGDLSGLADGERAAALWAAQMRAFANALVALPEARTLDAELFFADPAQVLPRVAARLAVPLSTAEAAEIVAGPLFSTYSKNPELRFDNAARLMQRSEVERTLSKEVDQARRWLERNGVDSLAAVEAAAV